MGLARITRESLNIEMISPVWLPPSNCLPVAHETGKNHEGIFKHWDDFPSVVSIKQLLTCCSWDWQESWGNLQALRWFPQCGLHEVRAPHDSWSWQSSSLWYSTRQQPRIWTNCLNDYWLIDQILTDFECQSGLLVSLVMRMLIQWAYRESSLSVNQIVISSHVSNHLTVFSLASISFSFTAEMAMS